MITRLKRLRGGAMRRVAGRGFERLVRRYCGIASVAAASKRSRE